MKRLASLGVMAAFAATLLVVQIVWGAPRPAPLELGYAAGPSSDYRIYGEGSGRVINVRLDAFETTQEIASGVKYRVWTFNGTVPGPVIRVKVGDTVRFTLRNKSTLGLSHSIDFHAAQTAWDRNYQPVEPGKTLTFDWVARFPGVFMYHCGVPPVLHHIANGMYGAIIVEPATPLPPAREYVLVSSEFYPTAKPVQGVLEGDVDRMLTPRPGYVVFNGKSNLYLDSPLVARPNELIRLWVMDAGPTLTTAFHVIGALFDQVYADGNPTSVMNGIQTWNVPPGGGAMFELRIPDAGLYPFVSHSFAYTGLGSVGVLNISADAPAAPARYPFMATPFDGGLTPAKAIAPEPGSSPSPSPTPTAHPSPTGAASSVTVDTANVAFEPTSIEVKEGAVELTLVNHDAFGHDFTVDALEFQVVVGANETKAGTFDASPGTYQFYCSVPGHKEAGMVGTLTVLPGAGH